MSRTIRSSTLGIVLVSCLIGVCAVVSAEGLDEIPDRHRIDVLPWSGRAFRAREVPVNVGLVFPTGELTSLPGGRVVDGAGRPVAFDASVTGWWDEEHRNIKWLLLHFKADEHETYYFERGDFASAGGAPIATKTGDAVSVDTGPVQVTLGTRGELFDSVRLHGRPIVQPINNALTITSDDGTVIPLRRTAECRVELEEATPLQASVKTTGYFEDPAGTRVARLELRYLFYKGESFVRLYHALMWMVRDPKVGFRDISIAMRPDLRSGSLEIGVVDGEPISRTWDSQTALAAVQRDGEQFEVMLGQDVTDKGQQLAGWFSVADGSGRGAAIAVRSFWETYPKAFSWRRGVLRVATWPAETERLSFEQEAIMPPRLFYAERFKGRPPLRLDHYVYDKSYEHDATTYVYTPEGSARTHEMVVHFFDRDSQRTPAQIHSLVLRQDPKLALRVPVLGMSLTPRDPARHPDIERAADQLGRMILHRWVITGDYGYMRYGLIRAYDSDFALSGHLSRWMDLRNTTYSLSPGCCSCAGATGRSSRTASIRRVTRWTWARTTTTRAARRPATWPVRRVIPSPGRPGI